MDQGASAPAFYRALVALETDPTRYYGPEARRPAVLSRQQAEQVLAHLAADLQALLPEIAECSLLGAGALYDQTEILAPGYPVLHALEQTVASRGGGFRPGLVSVGAEQGRMPVAALQPSPTIPLSALLLLPLAVYGDGERIEALGQAMEYRFLEEGQLSAHSANGLQSAFGVGIEHARFMTLTDLAALLRLQLEHFGFLPLWELLDAALSGRTEPLAVSTGGGFRAEWRDRAVHVRFETFDHWANHGAGAGMPAERLKLADGYGEHTREVRQYVTTLRAHGVPVRFELPDGGGTLEGRFFSEESPQAAGADDPAITEHNFENLGTIAITHADQGRVVNYYPLTPGGLNDIHATLRDRVPAGRTVAFPVTLVYDEASRRLRPDG